MPVPDPPATFKMVQAFIVYGTVSERLTCVMELLVFQREYATQLPFNVLLRLLSFII